MDQTVKTAPEITVFMAAYNAAAYIKEAIDSVLAQTFTDFELLIINDGSTDNTQEIVQNYTDCRIKLVNNNGNKGLTFTRQRGVNEAKGKYLAVLDADDVAMPDRLQVQYDYMQANIELALCGGQAIQIDENSKYVVRWLSPVFKGQIHAVLSLCNIFVNSSLMMRLDCIKAVGNYREFVVAEDYELSIRLAASYEVANLDQVLVKYRVHHSNTSGNTKFDIYQNIMHSIYINMPRSCGIATSPQDLALHAAIFSFHYSCFTLQKAQVYLEKIKPIILNGLDNRMQLFVKQTLHHKWFELVQAKAGLKIWLFFQHNSLFESSFVTVKQCRRLIKQVFLSLLFVRKKQ